MKIVIDIDDEDYKRIQDISDVFNSLTSRTYSAIRNGTSLPKGHGDLKDMGNLQHVFDLTREDPIYSGKDIERAIKSIKTTIEADKER